MIHFFDGFKTPIHTTAGYTLNDASTITQFIAPAYIGVATDYMFCNAGSYVSNRTYFRYTTGRSRVKAPSLDKLVVGLQTLYRNQVFVGLPLRSDEKQPFHLWNSELGAYNGTTRLQSELPYLYLTDSQTTLMSPTGTIYRTGITSDSLFLVSNDGINIKVPHFYEVVYDFQGDVIELWMDDVLQTSVAYTFTPAQKTASWYLYPEFCGPQPSYSSVSSTYQTDVGLIYAANERLGPVKTVLKKPASDYAVDASFGPGPHYTKLSISSNTLNAITTNGTSSANAMFSTTPESITTQILGVNVLGRASSEHVSALKTIAIAKLTLETNGTQWEGSSFDLPEMASAPSIESLELNPITGLPWTVQELNDIRIGMKMSMRPRS